PALSLVPGASAIASAHARPLVRAGAEERTGRPNNVTHWLTTTTTHRPKSLRARSLSPRLPFTRAPDGGDGLDAARNQVAAPETPQLL
ncbi:unnamed protein product, partial [Staurois parvus]